MRCSFSLWFLAPLLCAIVAGCVKNDEKYINLGNQFVLSRLHGGVSVEDMATTNGCVPPEVVSLGFNDGYIVAYARTNSATNAWIIRKSTREVIGPLTQAGFALYLATNEPLRSVKLKDVWDY